MPKNTGEDAKADESHLTTHSNFRMYKTDYLEVKLLALRDGMTIQAFLNRAVAAYCLTRGVKLSGKDPHIPYVKPKK